MRLEPSTTSAVSATTATTVVCSANCIVQAVVLNPGTAASVINLYDPSGQGVTTSTNATLKMRLVGAANTSSVVLPISASGVEFKNGLLMEITGAAATGYVEFARIS